MWGKNWGITQKLKRYWQMKHVNLGCILNWTKQTKTTQKKNIWGIIEEILICNSY